MRANGDVSVSNEKESQGARRGLSVGHAIQSLVAMTRIAGAVKLVNNDKRCEISTKNGIKYQLTNEQSTTSSGTTFANAPSTNDASLLTQ